MESRMIQAFSTFLLDHRSTRLQSMSMSVRVLTAKRYRISSRS
ncbi:hypothetical protein ANCCAN_30113 [Ancylostoma caninum]|uniref:Uncharacterized protein n=1 Tax=Ancylostoma caninum TaxID=29170 RepID=A0A368F1W6_ANCCA|nr:hypothetical protein ANCCAN_30113 [Ancylostoma caninum]